MSGGTAHRITDLIGRELEFASVEGFIHEIREGPRALVLEGAPGIGKTSLWQAGITAAKVGGLQVLSTRPGWTERVMAFAGLGDILEPVIDEVLDDLADPQRAAIEVALQRATRTHPQPRSAVGVGTLNAVRQLAARGPLLIAIDDLQWLDRSSAAALEFCLRRLESEPVGLLATLRTGHGAAVPLALDGIGDRLGVRRLEVGPLAPGALMELLRERLDVRLGGAQAARLYELSEGNPLLALELVRAAERRGVALLPGHPVELPDDIERLLRDRVAALAPDVRDVLLTAAALAKPTRTTVGAALGPRATPALMEAVDADLLVTDGDHLRIAHPLLAAAVYASATKPARRRLHARLAEVTTVPEERAWQLAAASLPPDGPVAAELAGAAALARARGAPELAAELADMSCRFTPPSESADLRARATDAAYHHIAAGELRAGREAFELALSASAPGPSRAEVMWRLAMALRIANDMPQALDLLREAVVESSGDAAVMARVHEKLAMCLFHHGDLAEADEQAHLALELSETLEDERLEHGALNTSGIIRFSRGQGPLPPSAIQRLFALEDRLGPLPPNESARFAVGMQLAMCDQLEEARPLLEGTLNRAESLGEEIGVEWAVGALAQLEWRAGNWEKAERHARTQLEVAERMGEPGVKADALSSMSLMDASRGRIDIARARASEAVAEARLGGFFPALIRSEAVLGFISLSLGRAADAHEHLGPMLDRVSASGLREPGLTRLLWDDIEACIASERLDRAEGLIDELTRQGRALDRAWALATAARGRGLLAAARGDLPGAVDALEASLVEQQRLGQPFELGRTLVALGVARRRTKQKRTARQAIGDALEIFERLGAVLWASAARGELERIGGRAPRVGGLTSTELRIAHLVAEGHSNREIAERLFLSPKTVAANLTSVFAKLGVRSRTELAHHLLRGDTPPR